MLLVLAASAVGLLLFDRRRASPRFDAAASTHPETGGGSEVDNRRASTEDPAGREFLRADVAGNLESTAADRPRKSLADLIEITAVQPVEGNPTSPFASVFIRPKETQNSPDPFSIGDTVAFGDDARVEEIHAEKVVFSTWDGRETLPFRAADSPAPLGDVVRLDERGRAVTERMLPLPSGEYLKFNTATHPADHRRWLIDRAELDWLAGHPEQVLSEVTLVPAEGSGLKIHSIRSGSVVATRGLAVGDVILAVNGVRVGTVGELRRTIDESRAAGLRQWQVDVVQSGAETVIVYQAR